MREHDWGATALGPVEGWPQSLRTVVDLVLGSGTMLGVLWGPAALVLYNAALARSIGGEHGRTLGRPLFDVWPDGRPLVEPHVRTALAGEETVVRGAPARFARADATLRGALVDITFTPVRDESGRVGGVLVRLEEAAPRVHPDRAERESHARLKEAFRIETVGVIFWGEGFCLTDMNEAFLRMTGFTRKEALGKTWAELTPPAFHAASRAAVEEVMTRGESTPFEKQYIRKDGSHWWGHFAARRIGAEVVEFVVDVTARREVEERLRASEEWQGFLLELSDALRPLGNAMEIQSVAARLLGEQLGSDRASHVEVDETRGEFVVSHDWHRPNAGSDAGRLPLDDWLLPWLAGGRTLVVRDVRTDPAIPDSRRDACAGQGIGSMILVPHLNGGRLAGVWLTTQRAPRDWTGDEVRLVEEVAARTSETLERARAQAELRDREARHAFLLDLSDRLRPLADPLVVQERAASIVGEQLGLDRCAYGDIGMGEEFVVQRDYAAPDLASGVGRLPARIQGWALARLRRGEGLLVEDVRTDPRLTDPDVQSEFAALGIVAVAAVPVMDGDRLLAGLVGAQSRPRAWTRSEVQLIEDAADRTFQALERARAEAALRRTEERFRAIVDTATDYAIFTTDPEGQIETWPMGAQRVFGWTAAEAGGAKVDVTFTPEDRADGAPEQERSTARTAGQALDVRWHMRKDGSRIFIDGIMRPLRDSDGTLTGFVKVGQDVTERRAIEEALRESEARFRQFGEASSDVLWIRSRKTLAFEYVSPALETIFGISREEVLGGDHVLRWAELIHDEDRDRALDDIRRVRAGERVQHVFRIVRPSDGELRWIRNTDFPLFDAEGKVQRIGGIAQDATHAVENEERFAVLLAELQHRTRNLVGVVRAMADRTLAGSVSLDDFRARFRDRLGALARVNGLLSRLGQDLRITFDELLLSELLAHGVLNPGGPGSQVTLDGPDGVRLRSSTVQTFALALHELTMNALKHGALSRPEGRLSIGWRRVRGRESGPHLRVEWRETGVPVLSSAHPGMRPSWPLRRGYGLELIERALPYQLGAETIYEFGPDGVRCTITLPVSSTLDDASALAPSDV